MQGKCFTCCTKLKQMSRSVKPCVNWKGYVMSVMSRSARLQANLDRLLPRDTPWARIIYSNLVNSTLRHTVHLTLHCRFYYPRDNALHSAVFAVVRCLSVRLSHAKPIVKLFWPSGSLIILVFDPCVGTKPSLLRAPVSEMTYTVSSGTLNSTIPYRVA